MNRHPASPGSRTMVRMTRITVGLDDDLAALLAERAAQAGLTPEELAGQLLAEDLSEDAVGADASTQGGGFAFFDAGSSPVLRGREVDELLAEGFGQ